MARSFQVISPEPGPRFLGLALAERNRRVARRVRGEGASHDARATLTLPDGVAITPALAQALPVPDRTWHLTWRSDRPPLVWRGPDARADDVPQAIALPANLVLDVRTPAARRRASWQLLKASGKPGDGWLSRHVHRKVSRLFSYVFLQIGLSADVATFLTLGVGLAAAWLLAQTTHETMIAGGALFWFASIADGIDGEMARLTLSDSAYGEQLDTAVDQLTHLSALVGVLVGWWRQGMGPAGVALAVTVVAGVPLVLLWVMSLVRRARRTDQFFVVAKPIEAAVKRAARETGVLPLHAAAAVFVLFRREAFSFTFLLVSLVTGQRVAYPAIIAAGLLVVVVTLGACRRPVEAALHAEVSRA